MLVCSNCGSRQPDSGTFCDLCGAKLVPDAPLSPASPAQAPDSPAVDTDPAPEYSSTPPADATGADELVCGHCGRPLLPSAIFCHLCGTPTGKTPTHPTPPVGAENAPTVATSGSASTPVRRPRSQPDASPPQSGLSATLDLPGPDVQPGIPGVLSVCDSKTTICFPGGKLDLVIGRRDQFGTFEPDIDLTDEGGAQKGVSRQHARIYYREDQVYIQDLGSSNGTYVNQRQLKAKQSHRLHDRDTIWLGHMRLIFFTRSSEDAT